MGVCDARTSNYIIICPHGKEEISLTEAISHQITHLRPPPLYPFPPGKGKSDFLRDHQIWDTIKLFILCFLTILFSIANEYH